MSGDKYDRVEKNRASKKHESESIVEPENEDQIIVLDENRERDLKNIMEKLFCFFL